MYSSKSQRHRSKHLNHKSPARRWLAFLLTVCMLIPLVAPIDTLAEDSNNTLTPIEKIVSDQTIDSDVQTILPNDSEVETFTEALLPSIISQEEVQQNQYIGRVRAEEENLNTLVFKNADGTNTMRIFNHPVKYVDTDGTVKDISLKLESTSNGYQPAAHSIATTFANQLSDGIRMRYESIDLLLMPVMQSSSSATQTAPMALASLSTNSETVSYPFGVNTTLEYTLTYTGYKEDIVVSQYTGQTEYNFFLQTGGLVPEMDAEGGWILKDSEGNPKASLGDIIIFTADERNNTLGRLTVETVKANQIYLLTIHVDSDWLSDPDTMYPIRIDPAMDVINTSDGSNAIEDLTLNSNAGSSMTSKSLSVGKRESYGISRILMRFPGLDLTKYISADQIISVTVGIRDILCESTPLQVYCHAYNEAWVSSPSWTTQNPNNYNSTVLSQKSVSYAAGLAQPTAHRYQFDITAAVKDWFAHREKIDYGILFKASADVENGTTYNAKTMASFNRTSNQPNLTINYQPGVIYPTVITVKEGSSISLSAGIISSEYVRWDSTDVSRATVDSNGTVTGIAAGKTIIKLINTENDEDEIIDTCVVYVTVDDLYDTIVYLKNSHTNSYIGAEDKNENTSAYVNFYTQEAHPYQMWNLELDEDAGSHIYTGRFKINELHSLGLVLEMQESECASFTRYVHTADGSTDNERQYWYLKRMNSSNFAIVSDYNEYALTQYNNRLAASVYNGSSVFSWSVEEYQLPESELTNMIATTSFTNHNSKIFTYSVDDSLIQSELFVEYGISLSDVRDAVERWNGISPNVVLRYTANENSSMIKIHLAPEFMYKLDSLSPLRCLTVGDHAVTYASNNCAPTSLTELFQFDDKDSQFMHIYVSSNYISDTILDLNDIWSTDYDLTHSDFNHQCALCSDNGTQAFIMSIITHEVGHALKLKHYINVHYWGVNDENDLTTARIQFPSIMQCIGAGVSGNRSSLLYTSAMGEKPYSFTCFNITPFDKMVLRLKYSVIGGITS